jgi:hypothetical protein
MNALKTIWSEAVGLFVDDGWLALLIVVWLAVNFLGLPALGLPSPWRACLLFGGLVVILADSTLRRGRRR